MYQGLNQAQRRLTTFQRGIDSVMGKIASALASIKIGETIKNGVQDAMSVETSIENLNRTLQENSNIFQNWANTQAQAYGMSTQEAYKYGSTFSNLISSFQSDTSQITNSTQELMKATAIVASNTGRTFEDTSERIRSGLLGSTEAIEDLGIYTNISMLQSTEAFSRFANGKTWQQLDFQTQQQIRLAAILEQAYARYGDTLANTTQSRHNQFIASLKNVQLALGQAFLPIYNAVLPPLTAFMNMLSKAISVIAIFTTAIFGKPNTIKQQAKATTGLSDSVGNLSTAASSANDSLKKASSSTKKAATEAKKATKEIGGLIGGLDEINNLSVSTTAGTSGSDGSDSGTSSTPSTSVGGIGDLGTIDMGDAIDTSGLEAKAEKIKAIFDKIKKFISDHRDAIISIMAGLMAGLAVIVIANWSKIGGIFTRNFPLLSKIFSKLGKVIFKPFTLLKKGIGFLLGLNPVVLGVAAVISVLVGALTYLWRTNEDFRKKVIKTWKVIKDTLKPWLEGLWTIFKVLAEIVGVILGAAFKFLGKIIVKVVEVLANGFMDSILEDAPKLKEMGENFKRFAKNIEKTWNKIKKLGFKKTVEILIDKIKKAITKKIKELKDGVIKKVKSHIKEIKDSIKEKWDEVIDSVKDFVIDIKSKVEDFKEKVEEKWNEIVDWFKDKALEIGSNVEDFKEKVSEKWDDVKDWIKDKALDIKSKVEDFKDKVSDKWDEVKKWAKDKIVELGSKVEDFKDKVSTKVEDAKRWISDKSVELKTKVEEFKEKVSTRVEEAKKWISTQVMNLSTKVEEFKEKTSKNVETAKNWLKTQVLNLSTKVDEFKEKASQNLNTAKNWLGTQVLNLSTNVGSFLDKAKSNFEIAKSNASTWILNVGASVGSFYQKALESFNNAKNNAGTWILNLGVSVGSFYQKALESFNSAKSSASTWVLNVGAKVGSFLTSAQTSFNDAKGKIGTWVLNVGASVSSFYSKAKTSYDSAKNSIKSWSFSVGVKVGSFTTKLKSAYESAKKTVKSWSFSVALKITSSASAIKTAVNNVIKSINNNVLGKIKIKLPGILGGGTWTAPKIPYLAKGGIVDSATLAVVGEQGRKILRSIVEIRYKKYSVNSWKAKFDDLLNMLIMSQAYQSV